MRREKRFRRYLSADDILHFRIVREDGSVEEVAIAYELIIEGTSYHPCRIDNAHGEIHMDRLDVNGNKIGRIMLGHIEPRMMIARGLNLILVSIENERNRILQELDLPLD